MKRVLFVCVENACRSQIAEGFARHYGHGKLEAFSTGSQPRGQVDQQAIAVMRERGIDISGHTSKSVSALPSGEWDAVVTMGCGEACPAVPAKQRVDWHIPNPAHLSVDGYRQLRDVIEAHVKTLIDAL